ncbi:MAG: hypothetical protein HY962_10075 [Ignavibacteriae bacterium]|nr:hypothetical protein [Ignavibacteriota bacterium]
MEHHPWLQHSEVIALCPKCGAEALRRSHSKTRLERFKRAHTLKRVFRCHECGWRGWVDEAKLRYSASGIESVAAPMVEGDDTIPNFTLDDGAAPIEAILPPERDIPRPATPAPPPASPTGGAPETPSRSSTFPPDERPAQVIRPPLDDDGFGDVEMPSIDAQPKPYSEPQDLEFHSSKRHKGRACPSCGEFRLFRSRPRNIWETLRRKLLGRRPYRCHKCGWRGWFSADQ